LYRIYVTKIGNPCFGVPCDSQMSRTSVWNICWFRFLFQNFEFVKYIVVIDIPSIFTYSHMNENDLVADLLPWKHDLI
jgi:hypothetical protein